MITVQQLLILIVSFSFIIVVWELIRFGRLRPGYSLLWFMFASIFLVIAICGGLVNKIAQILAVHDALSVFFTIGVFFLTILLLNQSILISTLARRNKEIAQRFSILQWQVKQLKDKTDTEMSIP